MTLRKCKKCGREPKLTGYEVSAIWGIPWWEERVECQCGNTVKSGVYDDLKKEKEKQEYVIREWNREFGV